MSKKYNEIDAKDNMKLEAEVNDEVVTPKEKKNLQKLIDVQPKKVKRSLFGRFITAVLGPEGLPGIGSYVNEEIVKPAIKNIIFDAITSAASMAMFGEKGGPVRGRNQGPAVGHRGHRPAVNYSSNYNGSQHAPSERLANPIPKHSMVEDYRIEDRYGASHVLTSLTENADMYGSVSVADYYDLIGVPSKYTDNNYGWTHDTISRATILPVRGGYIIKLPPVEVI